MREGFQLNPHCIAEEIHDAIVKDGWSLMLNLDTYVRPSYDGTGMYVTDKADRAVVVFVGSRDEAAKVTEAAKAALHA